MHRPRRHPVRYPVQLHPVRNPQRQVHQEPVEEVLIEQVHQEDPPIVQQVQRQMADQQRHRERHRPLFNGKNWTVFKHHVLAELRDEEVFNVATGVTPQPAGEGQEVIAWDRLNNRAIRIFNDYLSDEVCILIQHHETAAAIWTALTDMYEIRNESNMHAVQQRFFDFKYNATQPARENAARLNSLVADCRSVGVNISDASVITKLLHTLPESYEALIWSFRTLPEPERTIAKLSGFLVDKDELDKSRKNDQRHEREEKPHVAAEKQEVQPALAHRVRSNQSHAQQRPNQNQQGRPPHQNNNFG